MGWRDEFRRQRRGTGIDAVASVGLVHSRGARSPRVGLVTIPLGRKVSKVKGKRWDPVTELSPRAALLFRIV